MAVHAQKWPTLVTCQGRRPLRRRPGPTASAQGAGVRGFPEGKVQGTTAPGGVIILAVQGLLLKQARDSIHPLSSIFLESSGIYCRQFSSQASTVKRIARSTFA